MQKITTIQYVENNNGRELLNLLKKYGCTREPRGFQELQKLVKETAKINGEKFDEEFILLHPDYKAIKKHFTAEHKAEIDKLKAELKTVSEKKLNATGDEPTKPATIQNIIPSGRGYDILLGAGLFMAGTALIIGIVNVMSKKA
jgi:hypothetical protein